MDGGSTDQTVEVVRKYERWLTYWQSCKDGGQSSAIRRGIERSTGKILNWLNSDDFLLPSAIIAVIDRFRDEQVVAVYGNRITVDEQSIIAGKSHPPARLLHGMWRMGQPIGQELTFFTRKGYDEVGGIDESLFFCMDYSLYVRLFSRGSFRKARHFVGAI